MRFIKIVFTTLGKQGLGISLPFLKKPDAMGRKKIYGVIYTAKEKTTGKYYVGASTKGIKERIKGHEKKSNAKSGSLFHEAIATCGIDQFEWKTETTAGSANELAEKERELIVTYHAKEDGFNRDRGGGFRKEVYQYEMEGGKLVGTFKSLKEAGKVVGATKKQISRACLSVNQTFKGYYWNYNLTEPFIPRDDKRRKSLYQINFAGIYIERYRSISEASELTGINKSSIAKVCRGERNHAGGYLWEYG